MSQIHSTISLSSSFHSIINNALKAYEKRTKNNLLFHPLAEQLQTCNSPGAILQVLQQQVEKVNRSQTGDEMLTKWLDPTVKVLYAFTEALGEGVGLVCFKVVFSITICTLMFFWAGFLTCKSDLCGSGRPPFGVYPHSLYLRTGDLKSTSQAVKDVRASHGTIIDVFERMECFFLRLETYIEVQPTTEMRDIIIKIMVEVLSILAIVTKEVNRYRMSGFFQYNWSYCPQLNYCLFRKLSEKAVRKRRYRGRSEEAGYSDTRGGSDGYDAGAEGHSLCR